MAAIPFIPDRGVTPTGGDGLPVQAAPQALAPVSLPYDAAHDPRYRAMPNVVTGEVITRDGLLLQAKAFGLEIDFYYGSKRTDNTEYGNGRSANVHARVISSTSANAVTVLRGDFTAEGFTKVGSSGGVTTYAAVANAGVVTSLSFDGAQFTQYLADGTQINYKAQVAGGNPVTHQLTLVKNASGVAHSYLYGSGVEAGLLKTIQLPGGNLVTFTYAPGGAVSLLNSIQDFGGRLWTLQYDANHNLTTYATPLGCSTQYGYATPHGVSVINTIQDPRGFVSTYAFDRSNNVASLASGSGVWSWTYNPTNDPPSSVQTSPNGALTTFISDTNSVIVGVLRPDGVNVSYTYSNRVRTAGTLVAGARTLTYDPVLWVPTGQVDELGNRITLQYDGFANLTTQTDGTGAVMTFGYAGSGATRQRIRQTDALGRVTSYSFTADGLLQSVADPRGLVTTLNYDSFGNLVSLVNSDGTVVTQSFDSLNRLIARHDELGRITSCTWDVGESRTSVQDRTGVALGLRFQRLPPRKR